MIQLTNAQIERLIELKQRKSYADLAESEFGDRSLAVTLRSAMRKYKKVTLPEPAPSLLSPPLIIPYANSLIIGDLHAPYQNNVLLQQAMDLALSAGVKQMIIAGDLHDFNSLSSLNKGEPTTPAELDISHSRQVLAVAAHNFERIYVTPGNHDEYWTKKKGGTFQDLIYTEVLQGKYGDQITATNYDYLQLGDDWIIGHLSSYDEEAGKLAARISDLMCKHVAVGHDHIVGHKHGEKGYIGISIGAMLTPDRFWYKVRRLNTFPPFALGFLLLIDGWPYHFSETGNTPLNGEFRDFKTWKGIFNATTV